MNTTQISGYTWQTVTTNPLQLDDPIIRRDKYSSAERNDSAACRKDSVFNRLLYAELPLNSLRRYIRCFGRSGLIISCLLNLAIINQHLLGRVRHSFRLGYSTDWSSVKRAQSLTATVLWLLLTICRGSGHDVRFSFRSLDAYVSVPQLAVFSDHTMAGLIQIVGLNGGNTTRKFKETYELYIPKEMLRVGSNELKLSLDRGLYAGTEGDEYHWFEWDYAKLEAFGAPAVNRFTGGIPI